MQLSRMTLAEQIALQLFDYIQKDGLKSGEALPSEAHLMTSFEVSRPIVREALRYLEGKGVIDIVNGKGATIRPITGQQFSDYFNLTVHRRDHAFIEMMEVRRALEVESASLAAQRRTLDELRDIGKILAQMQSHLDEFEAYIDGDVEFHLLIAAASHNEILLHVIKSIRTVSRDLMIAGLDRWRDLEADLKRVQQLHEFVYLALEQGDPAAASQAMMRHFDEAVSKLIGSEPD